MSLFIGVLGVLDEVFKILCLRNKNLFFFSNLFSSSNKPNKKPLPVATVKYNAPTTQVQPVGDPNKRTRSKYNLGDKAKAYEFLQDDLKTNPADTSSSSDKSEADSK
ncbi:hypothetical protein KUTeg_024551 [Tegillarca granosa]|uniref:Uncharacterized protein n=1 Tax=Tegillarca granosa TaxID=220873 RepID=A0ABQ9E3B7_TEGGR|nr:hypothetical protein KUTeg_024551 [Tegillarca granosa]